MKKIILTTVVVWGLVSTGLSYGIQGEVSSESFPSPVMELAS